MSIIVTSIPITNGGNFIYSPNMVIGSVNDKPVILKANNNELIKLEGASILFSGKFNLKNDPEIIDDLPPNADGIINPQIEFYGNDDTVILCKPNFWLNIILTSGQKLKIPCYEY